MLAIMKHISKPKSAAVIVQYGMSAHRIFALKLMFLLIWAGLGSDCQKMMGFKFSHPSTPTKGPISFLGPPRLTMYLPPQVGRLYS